MATTALVLPRLRSEDRARPKVRARHFPIENTVIWTLSFGVYIAVAVVLIFKLHYMIDDAYARIDNSFNVLFTRDPHLAAIGFAWPPLPSFLELPIIAFKNLWPPLVTQGFGGAIMAAGFSAGTVVLINSGLRWAGVFRGLRWLLCVIWLANPMTLIYGAQGMSEAEFIFFAAAAILVFLRWSESDRNALLPLLGVLVGAGCLCRNEMFVLAAFIGVAVIVRTMARRVIWREVETKALLFGLPALLVVMLWIGSMAIIMRDPLYWLHSTGKNADTAAVQTAFGLIHLNSWKSAASLVIGNSIQLYPAVLACLGLLAVSLVLRKGRLTGVLLASFGFPILAVDIYLLHGSGLAPVLRYQIFVIPFAFVLAIYVLRSFKGGRRTISAALTVALMAILGLSNVLTAQVLQDPNIAKQEAPLVAALASGRTVPAAAGVIDAADVGALVAPRVLALDKDHGLILADSGTSFPIVLNAPDPHLFVVTSDRNFEAAAAQPAVYHVEYFLVAWPKGLGAFDRLNELYPGLYDSGGGFSTLVGTVTGGTNSWRLYRITGPTGRE